MRRGFGVPSRARPSKLGASTLGSATSHVADGTQMRALAVVTTSRIPARRRSRHESHTCYDFSPQTPQAPNSPSMGRIASPSAGVKCEVWLRKLDITTTHEQRTEDNPSAFKPVPANVWPPPDFETRCRPNFGGARTTCAPESGLQRSELDEHRCHKHRLTWRSRISRSRASLPGPGLRFRTSGTDFQPDPISARPMPGRCPPPSEFEPMLPTALL